MPSLNVYLPDNLAMDLRSSPSKINLSKVCVAALRAEVSARMTDRTIAGLWAEGVAGPTDLEDATARRFSLGHVLASGEADTPEDTRALVGLHASKLLQRILLEGVQLAVGGGTQMWSVVRRLERRNLGLPISAIGVSQTDHAVPHIHANFLATMLSLLYAPRSRAMLVASPDFARAWSLETPIASELRRIIIGSCARFEADSPYARMLGEEITEVLETERAVGDFLGVFLRPDGTPLEPYPPKAKMSRFTAAELREHSRRGDTIVALAAAGEDKLSLIHRVLVGQLCNCLVTDERTASALLRKQRKIL
jgi:DNA-binding transcriptional regulator LsrR (DeoR family)